MPGRWIPHLASCLTPVSRGRYSTKARIYGQTDLGPTRKDDYQTFRARKAPGGKDLPLPPLLDPVVIEKRFKWKESKVRPDHANLTPFQKKLQNNPYAHILASPVRQCRTTQISLPVDLLTTLHARPHPITKAPWLLPISLTAENKRHIGPPYYCPLRKYIIEHLGKKKRWEKGVNVRMMNMLGLSEVSKLVWREDMPKLILHFMQNQALNKLRWFFSTKRRLIPVPSPRSEDIEGVDDVACVLFIKSLRTRADDAHDRAVEIAMEMEKWSGYVAKSFPKVLDPHTVPGVTHHAPKWYSEPVVPRLQPRAFFPELEFRTTIWRGKRVAVYSLTDLFGEEKTKELVQGSEYEKFGCLIMPEERHNISAQKLLLRLQAYLAQPGP